MSEHGPPKPIRGSRMNKSKAIVFMIVAVISMRCAKVVLGVPKPLRNAYGDTLYRCESKKEVCFIREATISRGGGVGLSCFPKESEEKRKR